MKLIKRFASFSAAVLLSLTSLTALIVPHAFATVYTCVWTGATDSNWNTAGNWSSCNSTVPQTGDVISFDLSLPSAYDTVLNNDITGLSVSGIILTGAGTTNKSYKVTGNKLTIAGTVTQSQTSGSLKLATDIDLGAPLTYSGTVNGLILGDGADLTKTLDLKTYDLTENLTGSACAINMTITLRLKGSGGITVSAGNLNLYAPVNTYTGSVTVNAGGLAYVNGALNGSSTVTMNGASQLILVDSTPTTFTTPVVMNSTGNPALETGPNGWACAGTAPPLITSTLSGSLTLNKDTIFAGSNDLNVTGTFTANGHALTVKQGTPAKITTSAGTVETVAKTTTVASDDKAATTDIYTGTKETLIIDGERRDIFLSSGSILKGTGKVNSIYADPGSTVAPGHSPGTITVVSTLSLSIGTTYEAEIKNTSEFDQIVVTSTGGNVTVNGAILQGLIVDGFKIKAGDTFKIIDNQTSSAVSGTFKDLAEGATFKISDGVFKISYKGGDGNDVVLTVVTVPTVPNTGFTLLRTNPYLSILATVMVTGSLAFGFRKLSAVRVNK